MYKIRWSLTLLLIYSYHPFQRVVIVIIIPIITLIENNNETKQLTNDDSNKVLSNGPMFQKKLSKIIGVKDKIANEFSGMSFHVQIISQL